ncbi:hypothetical protein [Desulfobacula sp.]|uniref:hypothetical protein n=1 Tax=Desulfobacula sp. TaxID=2593537 RepID=UPI001992C738|nr:hypothetical protein [Candidatus Brocadiales bacterium]MBL6995452.1 hypothetical protein [Desulfobacula sp.]
MSIRIQYDPDFACKRWIGYFDLLGMKQLYKSGDPISIFLALSKSIEELQKRATAWEDVGYAWFSDTIIIYTKDDSACSFTVIDNITRWYFYFLISGGVPVRGAVACDKFYSDKKNSLFFGEALIEAYEYGEAQDWIGFLLCPSAVKQLEELDLHAEKRLNYVYTDIPYKIEHDKFLDHLPACLVGNWVSENPIIEKLKDMKSRIEKEEIKNKYDRTIKFLETNRRKNFNIDR